MTQILSQSRGPEHRNAVVFACDDGHLPFALFAADRIRRIEPDGQFDLMICMPDISAVPERHLAGPIRFCQIDITALPEVPMFRNWISFATYFRWILPQAFADQYDTLLYLDTDIYLRRAGLQRLFDQIGPDVALAAASDLNRFRDLEGVEAENFAGKQRDMGGSNGEYYNAGVLMIKPANFLAADGFDRLVEGIRENETFDPIHHEQDQGALNIAFADDIVPISPLYNWCTRDWLNPRLVGHFDPYILHFAGRGKPWNLQDDPFISEFSSEYLDFIARDFPEFRPKAAPKSSAWRREHPKHGVRFLEGIRIALYRRRFMKTLLHQRNRGLDAKLVKMEAGIRAAAIG